MILVDSESAFYQHALELDGEIAREWAKRVQEIKGAGLHRAERRRAVVLRALQDARRERDDLHHAYHHDIPLRNCRVSSSILADFVLHNQIRVPQLPALVEEYKRRYPARWFSDTRPLHLLTLVTLPPRT
ncbi:hypothetical protein LIER_33331 [Lithospermum erythrorhizon]|uniref:Protein kinase domain-containing protein n=1 Tax=Lithospermum erythrorhizon TaxID=34254 RepID=A0AAV3RWE0_LITER